MPVRLNGKSYYRTAEACLMAGTSKNTFLRWVREELLADVERRDRRGWRLFSEEYVSSLRAEVNRMQTNQLGGGVGQR